ncbi:unnamed protein product, partial [Oikopleura dioica]
LLINRIMELCECQPNYLHNFRLQDFDREKPFCSFYDTVKCVAPVMDRKGLTKTNDCAPACHSYEFNQDKIQYRVPPKSDDSSKYFMTAVVRTTEACKSLQEIRPSAVFGLQIQVQKSTWLHEFFSKKQTKSQFLAIKELLCSVEN